MPTKFGFIWIGLRGLKIPDKKDYVTLRCMTLQVKLVPSQYSLAWLGLTWVEQYIKLDFVQAFDALKYKLWPQFWRYFGPFFSQLQIKLRVKVWPIF